jgi:hypothetical protein
MTAANAYAPHESKNNNKSQKQMRLPTPLRGHVMSRHKKNKQSDVMISGYSLRAFHAIQGSSSHYLPHKLFLTAGIRSLLCYIQMENKAFAVVPGHYRN